MCSKTLPMRATKQNSTNSKVKFLIGKSVSSESLNSIAEALSNPTESTNADIEQTILTNKQIGSSDGSLIESSNANSSTESYHLDNKNTQIYPHHLR